LYARECLSFGSVASTPFDLSELRDDVIYASGAGFDSYWLSQQVDLDAMVLAPWLSSAAPDLEIGVGVVPMQSRFPVHMAQAPPTPAAHRPARARVPRRRGGRNDWVVRDIWGLAFERPVAEMREYLRVV